VVVTERAEAMVSLGEGDLAAAEAAARSLLACDGRPMPFGRARTLLVLGRIRRAAKQKAPARAVLAAASEIFERLHDPGPQHRR
jgi:hypothetical protein